MMYTRLEYQRGLGANGSQVATTVGSTVGTIAAKTGVFGAFQTGSLAIPVIGAAIAGVTTLVSLFMAKNAQANAQKTASTKIVDQAEQLMKQNVAAWQASNKTVAEQEQSVQNFDALWQQVVNACNRPELGGPGQRCIHDRERGGAWPWPEYYRDVIANDRDVRANPSPVSEMEQVFASVSGGSKALPLMLMGGLLLWAANS